VLGWKLLGALRSSKLGWARVLDLSQEERRLCLCERCGVMEEAFDAKRRETGHFNEALLAAMKAAETYDQHQTMNQMTDQQRARDEARERAVELVTKVGIAGAINEYVNEYGADLGGEYVEIVDTGFSLMEAATQSFEKHGKDKVKAALEVGNAICAMSIDINKPFTFLIIFGALLVELASCPEARSALELARRTIPGVQV
jgi:hypothetical protein